MQRVFQVYGRYQGLRGNVSLLPSWTRPVLLVAALPALAVILLGVALLIAWVLVMILALFPLILVYRGLRALTGRQEPAGEVAVPRGEEVFVQTAPRRQVDVKILE